MAQKLISKSFRTPPGCWVRRVHLTSKGAEVGWDCPGGGGSGSFPTHEGGSGNYPSAFVKGVREVSHAGIHASGVGTKFGFELSPRYVRCEKRASDSVLRCQVYNQNGVLAGASRKRR